MAFREMLEPFIREAAAARVFAGDAHQLETACIQIIEGVFQAAHREDGLAVRWSLAINPSTLLVSVATMAADQNADIQLYQAAQPTTAE